MNTGNPIGVGIIGCGAIACWVHMRNLVRVRGVKIVGLADPDPAALERAGWVARAPAFSSADELLRDTAIDAVIIASPTAVHAVQLRSACDAGKHVYLEKPLAHDAGSLASVRSLRGNPDQVIALGYNWRFHPACQILRRELAMDSIGRVRALVSEFTEPAAEANAESGGGWRRDRRLGGGVLLDLASHHLDLYRWLLQEELLNVSSDLRSSSSDQDTACVRANTGSGVELCGYFSLAASRSHGLAVHGTKGVLRVDFFRGQITQDRVRATSYNIRRRRVSGGLSQARWRVTKLLNPATNPSHNLSLRAFITAIAHPGQRPRDLATVADGIAAVQAVLEAEARPFSGSGTVSGSGSALGFELEARVPSEWSAPS